MALAVGAAVVVSGSDEPAPGGTVRLSVEPGPRAIHDLVAPAFEEAARFVNREFRLPSDLDFRVVGQETARRLGVDGPEYHPSAHTVYVPWTFVEQAQEVLAAGSDAPQVAAPREQVLVHAVQFIAYHELAHGLIHLLDLPITGKEESSADSLAATLAFASGRLGATIVLAGGDLFEAEARRNGESLRLASSTFHDLDQQRYDQMICLAYGSDPAHHGSLVGSVRGLPASAKDVCVFEYQRQLRSWRRLADRWLQDARLSPRLGAGDDLPKLRNDPANARMAVTIGSKNFTEGRVMAEIYAQGLRAAGFRATTRLDLGDEHAALRAVETGSIDGYPEYTGTALLSLFGVPAARIPRRPADAFEQARAAFRDRGLTALAPAPFENANAVGLTRWTAARLGLRRLSQLREHDQDLVLHGSPECRARPDCLAGLRETYGLHFARFVPTPLDRRAAVLTSGRADLSIVFTTDPDIRRKGLVLLEDDRRMLPPYNPTLVVRDEVATPELRRAVQVIQSGLAEDVMQELNARVDIDGESPARAAAEYLEESGLR